MPEVENPHPPLVIGLLGGVAAGKSTVAGLLAERGFRAVDADALAREVSRDPAVLARIAARFGPDVLGADGQLRRERMAEIVFGDQTARKDLEALTHPEVRRRILAAMDEAAAAGQSVVLDVPLLLEGGLVDFCDLVVFVEVSDAARRARARGRGWDEDELARREAAQAPLVEKRRRADRVVPNEDDLEATRAAVDALLAEL